MSEACKRPTCDGAQVGRWATRLMAVVDQPMDPGSRTAGKRSRNRYGRGREDPTNGISAIAAGTRISDTLVRCTPRDSTWSLRPARETVISLP